MTPDKEHSPSLMQQGAEEAVARIKAERDEARQIVRDIHWMARRYADGRMSYAVSMFNDAVRKAFDAGWLEWKNDEPRYASDGMFSAEWVSQADTIATLTAQLAAAEERAQQGIAAGLEMAAKVAGAIHTETTEAPAWSSGEFASGWKEGVSSGGILAARAIRALTDQHKPSPAEEPMP